MKVLVTGANGFLAKNLISHLNFRDDIEVIPYTRQNQISDLKDMLVGVEMIFHLAGANRPSDQKQFELDNEDLTRSLCAEVRKHALHDNCKIPIVFSSSMRADEPSNYGKSKFGAETCLRELEQEGFSIFIFRLPNVFGKWSRPNYNSVVATFCHNIAHDLPISVDDENRNVSLVYIDDVVKTFLMLLEREHIVFNYNEFVEVQPVYSVTLGKLAETLYAFKENRQKLHVLNVGTGFKRALYSTFISYMPTKHFQYSVPCHTDERGRFVEMIKTETAGQISYFTAAPGVTRGGHFHHSKVEKFLVVAGKARITFRNILSNEVKSMTINAQTPEIIETIPGWAHNVENMGQSELIILTWANEVFDPQNADTVQVSV